MSKIWKCECKNYVVSDVAFTSVIFDPECPHCGRLWSSFTSEDDLPITDKSAAEDLR